MKKIREVHSLLKKAPHRNDKSAKIAQILQHPLIQHFREQNPHCSDFVLQKSFLRLEQYIQEQMNCRKCPGLDRCPNLLQGHSPILQEFAGYIDLHMRPCPRLRQAQEKKKRKQLIECYKVPIEIQEASLSQVELSNQERHQVIVTAIEFCQHFAKGKPSQGLYLYGPFGVGKSYIAGAIMNELAKFGIGSIMMHTSELFGELRRSIQENRIQEKIEMLYSIPLLILDDIGSESLTPWIRDDVLSVIFHHRMADRLPIIFTSNLSLHELESYFSYTTKGGFEQVKGMRIMERIRHSVKELLIEGRNRRYDQNHLA